MAMSRNSSPRRRASTSSTKPSPRRIRRFFLTALRGWGALDENYVYKTNLDSSRRRGYDKDPGGGVAGPPIPSKPLDLHDIS